MFKIPKIIRVYSGGSLLLPLLVLFGGCGQNTAGLSILDDLRADGLIHDIGDEPTPDFPKPDSQRSWSFPVKGDLSLASFFEAADQLNPRIAAARARIGAAGGRAWQASLYPNPAFDLESENLRPSGGGMGESETTVGFSQPIIMGGRRESAIAVGHATVNTARWEFEQVRRGVHGQLRRVLTEIVYFQHAIELHQDLQTLTQRALDIAQARFEARAAPESEELRARLEFNRLGLAIERLHGEVAAAGERLDALLGGHHVDLDRVAEPDLVSLSVVNLPALDEMLTTLRETHPAVLASEAHVVAATRQVELERARGIPDITARIGVGINHDDDEGFVEAGVSIPLSINDENQGSVLAARFGVIRAQQEVAVTADELAGALAEAYRRWESATSRLVVFEEQILAGARRLHEQTSAGYEAAKLPFLDLLDAQRTLIEANIAKIELQRAVSLHRSKIYELLGEYPDSKPHPLGNTP